MTTKEAIEIALEALGLELEQMRQNRSVTSQYDEYSEAVQVLRQMQDEYNDTTGNL